MPKVKQYTATRELKLDCGHTVKSGESYQIVSAFACAKDGQWPLTILMSCFSLMARKQESRQPNSASAPVQPVSKPAPEQQKSA